MSYILDALKKSEQERQRQMNPSVSPPDVAVIAPPVSRAPANVNPLLFFFAILVALVLVFFGLQWSRQQSQNSPAEPAQTKADAVVAEPEIVQVQTQTELSVSPPPVIARPVTQPAIEAPASAVPEQVAATDRGAVETRSLPPLAALRRIPQLMITGHIYSPVPEKRTVSMNNRQWNEGDFIAPGIILKEITPGGILLDVDGWPLHVGRSKGWQAVP